MWVTIDLTLHHYVLPLPHAQALQLLVATVVGIDPEPSSFARLNRISRPELSLFPYSRFVS